MRSRDKQLAEKELKFGQFEYIRCSLPFVALADELDWVTVNPLITHRVMEDGAHDISNFRFRSFCPLYAIQPLFYCD